VRIAWLLVASALIASSLDAPTRQLARDILKQLVEINTTNSVGSTTVAAEAMRKRLLEAGFAGTDLTVLGPNGRKGNLVARFRGTNTAARKPILIIAHLDVVEARREDWTTDPFQLVEKDGYFYGRGTQDMKSQDAIMVTDLIRFKREGYQPDRDIILALTADEEGGKYNGVDWLLKHHRDLIDAEYVLNPDSGGVYTDHGRPVDIELEVTEKLYASFQLRTTNPGGHSSLPVPDNAIYHITDALAKLENSPFPFELNAVTRGYFKQLASGDKEHAADINAILETPPDQAAIARLSREAQFNALMRTTCIPTMLQAGHAENALPQVAQAVVNCRILPGHSAEEVRQRLIRIFNDPQVTVGFMDVPSGEVRDRAPDTKAFPPVAPPREIVEPLERIAGDIWPGAPVTPDMEAGASDSIYTIAAGLPSYGFSGLAIDRNDIRAHGKDERLTVASYDQGVEFFYQYLKALTSAP
jgi:acetylornithine deacetylase/succinyl-diaminopimelate desuccinylase-like protein